MLKIMTNFWFFKSFNIFFTNSFNYKKNQLKEKRHITLKNLRTFKYIVGMTDEEITEKVNAMITFMKTDEYWLERGGNGPYIWK